MFAVDVTVRVRESQRVFAESGPQTRNHRIHIEPCQTTSETNMDMLCTTPSLRLQRPLATLTRADLRVPVPNNLQADDKNQTHRLSRELSILSPPCWEDAGSPESPARWVA